MCMRSQQMSTAFIRKTPNYPLLHTVFHLRQGKQRLLIRKAALSTISLAGAGTQETQAGVPPLGCAALAHGGAAGLSETRAPLCPWPLTNRTERSSVPARRHHCRGRPAPTHSRPQSRQQGRRARQAATLRLPHTQPAAPGSGGLGPQT